MIEFVLLGATALLAAGKVTGKGPFASWEWWKVAAPAGAFVAYYVYTMYLAGGLPL